MYSIKANCVKMHQNTCILKHHPNNDWSAHGSLLDVNVSHMLS